MMSSNEHPAVPAVWVGMHPTSAGVGLEAASSSSAGALANNGIHGVRIARSQPLETAAAREGGAFGGSNNNGNMRDGGTADARAMVPTFGLLQFCPEDLSSSPALAHAAADASALAREGSAGLLAPTLAAEARTWDAEQVAALRAAVMRRKRAAHGRLDAVQRIRWQLNEWHQRVIGRKRKVSLDDGLGDSDAKQARTDGSTYTGQPVVAAPSSSPKPLAMRTLVLNNGSRAVEAMGAAAAMGPVGVPHGSGEMQYTQQQQQQLQLQQQQQRKSGDKRNKLRRAKALGREGAGSPTGGGGKPVPKKQVLHGAAAASAAAAVAAAQARAQQHASPTLGQVPPPINQWWRSVEAYFAHPAENQIAMLQARSGELGSLEVPELGVPYMYTWLKEELTVEQQGWAGDDGTRVARGNRTKAPTQALLQPSGSLTSEAAETLSGAHLPDTEFTSALPCPVLAQRLMAAIIDEPCIAPSLIESPDKPDACPGPESPRSIQTLLSRHGSTKTSTPDKSPPWVTDSKSSPPSAPKVEGSAGDVRAVAMGGASGMLAGLGGGGVGAIAERASAECMRVAGEPYSSSVVEVDNEAEAWRLLEVELIALASGETEGAGGAGGSEFRRQLELELQSVGLKEYEGSPPHEEHAVDQVCVAMRAAQRELQRVCAANDQKREVVRQRVQGKLPELQRELELWRTRYHVQALHARMFGARGGGLPPPLSGGVPPVEPGAIQQALLAHDAALAATRLHGDTVTSFDWWDVFGFDKQAAAAVVAAAVDERDDGGECGALSPSAKDAGHSAGVGSACSPPVRRAFDTAAGSSADSCLLPDPREKRLVKATMHNDESVQAAAPLPIAPAVGSTGLS